VIEEYKPDALGRHEFNRCPGRNQKSTEDRGPPKGGPGRGNLFSLAGERQEKSALDSLTRRAKRLSKKLESRRLIYTGHDIEGNHPAGMRSSTGSKGKCGFVGNAQRRGMWAERRKEMRILTHTILRESEGTIKRPSSRQRDGKVQKASRKNKDSD